MTVVMLRNYGTIEINLFQCEHYTQSQYQSD